jgi:hypothetical protein
MTQTDRDTTSMRESWPSRTRFGFRRPRWWRELVLIASFYAVYDVIRGLIGGGSAQAQRDGHDVLRWEQLLHLVVRVIS